MTLFIVQFPQIRQYSSLQRRREGSSAIENESKTQKEPKRGESEPIRRDSTVLVRKF